MEFSKYWAREDYIFVTVAKWHAAKCPWHRNAQAGCSIREGELSIMLLITHPAPSDYLRRGTGSNEHWPNIPKSGPVSRSLSLYVIFGVIHSNQFQSKNLLVTLILQIHTFQLISCRGWFPVMMIWKQSQVLSELIKTTVVWLDSKVNCRGRHWLQIFLQVFKTSDIWHPCQEHREVMYLLFLTPNSKNTPKNNHFLFVQK